MERELEESHHFSEFAVNLIAFHCLGVSCKKPRFFETLRFWGRVSKTSGEDCVSATASPIGMKDEIAPHLWLLVPQGYCQLGNITEQCVRIAL